MPPVHSHVCTRHEAACVADEKHGRATEFSRFAQSPEHLVFRPFCTSLRVLYEELLHHVSDDVAGRDRVDPDVVLAPFGGKVACELQYPGLGRVVGSTKQSLVWCSH